MRLLDVHRKLADQDSNNFPQTSDLQAGLTPGCKRFIQRVRESNSNFARLSNPALAASIPEKSVDESVAHGLRGDYVNFN